MVKKTDPKLYKFKRVAVNEDKNHLVLKFKNLKSKQIKQLKDALNDFIHEFFVEPEEASIE